MLKKSLLSACLLAVCGFVSSCSLSDGIVGNYMCLNDAFSDETNFTNGGCNEHYACHQIETPVMFADTDIVYFKCYLCDLDEDGNALKYCNGECIDASEECGGKVCKPDTYQCDGRRLLKCNEDGIFLESRVCDEGFVCNADEMTCDPDDVEPCETGTYACRHNDLMQCKDDGEYALEKSCGELICDADNADCVEPENKDCEAGTYDCQNNVLLKCNEAGEFKLEQACDADHVCNAAKKQCDTKQADTCVAGTFRCSGKELQKCNDAGAYVKENTCGAEKLCDAAKGVCNECKTTCKDNKTLLECQSDGTQKSVSCDYACETNKCVAKPECTEGKYKCDGSVLMKCTDAAWKKSSTCTRQYACNASQKKCVLKPLDSDDDGVIDAEDDCPFNPKLTTGKGKYNCHPYDDMVYTIYNPYNLYDVVAILNGQESPYNKGIFGSHLILKIVLDRDINFAHYSEFATVADKNALALVQDNVDGSCSVLNWLPIRDFKAATFDGKGHKISTKKTSKVQCSFTEPLFSMLTGSTVENLKLAYDVNGTGHGLLANNIAISPEADLNLNIARLSNISYSGTLTTTDNSPVGGLVGSVGYQIEPGCEVVVENCWPESITINAHGAGSVGGVIGSTSSNMKFTASKNLYNIVSIAVDNASTAYIGGLFGMLNGSVTAADSSSFIQYKVGSITGSGEVGGFAGYINTDVSRAVGKVGKVSAINGSAGGFAGFADEYLKFSHIGVQVDSVSTDETGEMAGAGGFIGNGLSSSFEYIYVYAKKIVSKSNAGGMIATSRRSDGSTYSRGQHLMNYISVIGDYIEGVYNVGGVYGWIRSFTAGSFWNHVSSRTNLKLLEGYIGGAFASGDCSLYQKLSASSIASSRELNNAALDSYAIVSQVYDYNNIDLSFQQCWYYADAGFNLTTSGFWKESEMDGLIKYKNGSFASGDNAEMLKKMNQLLGDNDAVKWEASKFALRNPDNTTEDTELPILRISEVEDALNLIK